MTQITKEEILKLAEISKLKILDSEIESLKKEIDAVLSYAERVVDLASVAPDPISTKNCNVFREDLVDSTDSEQILNQAPSSEDSLFVVPRILEND